MARVTGPLPTSCCEVCLDISDVFPLTPDDPTYCVCQTCYVTYILYSIRNKGLVLAETAYPSPGLWSGASLGSTSSLSPHYS